ncbi:MAG: DUF5677 domain-containing protein [Terracidiphilus sp.]
MLFLTVDQHKDVLRRLVDFGKTRVNGIPYGDADLGYFSLMSCFLLQNLSAAETLLRISSSFGDEWYPATVGYTVARTMFEVDVTAHYITKSPAECVHQYIDFTAILNKKEMDACNKHRNSKKPGWQEPMESLWQNYWANRESEIERKYKIAIPQFTRTDKKGKNSVFQNWSGKTIHQMASEVDHTEAYDVFYSELSSFAHADVRLADRYLQCRPDGPVWSQKAREFDVGNVFRHAANFLTCHLELFGKQIKTWTEAEVANCWTFDLRRE